MNEYRGRTQGFDLTNMEGAEIKRVPVIRLSLLVIFSSFTFWCKDPAGKLSLRSYVGVCLCGYCARMVCVSACV
jgi:hypothetical protein